MVADPEVLERRLTYLRVKIADLAGYGPADRARVLGDRVLYAYLEHTVQQAIQCAIDVGAHIVASQGLGAPDTNAEIMTVLGARGVIPAELASRLAQAAGQRNVIVHLYLEIDPEKVYDGVLGLQADLPEFARAIAAWLDRNP